jgi:chromosome partitioning protein
MFDADSKGAVNYLDLAREVLQKNDLTKIKNNEKVINISNE